MRKIKEGAKPSLSFTAKVQTNQKHFMGHFNNWSGQSNF